MKGPRPSRAPRGHWRIWTTNNESGYGQTCKAKPRRTTLDQTRVCVDCMEHHRLISTAVTPEQTSVPAPHTRRARSASHHSSTSSGSLSRTISIPRTISLPTVPTISLSKVPPCITILTIDLALNFLCTVGLPTVPTRTTIVKNRSTTHTATTSTSASTSTSTSIPDHHTTSVHSRKHHHRR